MTASSLITERVVDVPRGGTCIDEWHPEDPVFYPANAKGIALGLNAAGGNLGGAVMQFLVPMVVGGAGLFGLVQGGYLHLQRAGYLYAVLAAAAAICAFRFMNNLPAAKSTPRAVLAMVRNQHTIVMSLLYIGTFGSFIGYAAAMPLLIRLNFAVVDPQTHALSGVNFAYYAFLGSLVGALSRPLGGWLADRLGGARVTIGALAGMVAGTLGVLATRAQLTPKPQHDPAVAVADQHWFPWFLLAFGAPWIHDPAASVRGAFAAFAGYYLFCLVLTWFVYARRHLFVERIPSLAHARI